MEVTRHNSIKLPPSDFDSKTERGADQIYRDWILTGELQDTVMQYNERLTFSKYRLEMEKEAAA